MNEPRIPVKIWVMLGLVILFALLLSYFLVIGILRRLCNRVLTTPESVQPLFGPLPMSQSRTQA